MRAKALICARGGSKGLPGKNVRKLAGVPLIGWAVRHARAVPEVDEVIVSTDDEHIAFAAREAGAHVPFLRPAALSGDRSPEWLVWRHALNWMHEHGGLPDTLLVVPTTAPLRDTIDLKRCLDTYSSNPDTDVVITVTDARRSPYFNMVTPSDDGYVRLVIPPGGKIVRRQDAAQVYDMTTVGYVARPAFVLEKDGIFDGRVRSVYVPPERALDIDTPLDFRIAECLISSREKS